MKLDINTVLSLLVAFQLIFIAVFLLSTGSGIRKSNVLLGIFFLLLGINIGDLLLQMNGITSFLPLFFLLDDAFLLLFGPLLYLYTLTHVYRNFRLEIKHGVHLIPFVICLLGLLLIYSLAEGPYEHSLNTVGSIDAPKGALLIVTLFYAHGGIYLFFSKRVLRKYDRNIRDQYSNLSKVNLDWLHFIINSIIAVWVLGIMHTVFSITVFKSYINAVLLVFMVFLFYFINRILFKVLRRSEVLSGIPYAPKPKYVGSTLSDVQRTNYAEELVSYMEREQPFVNPDLSVNQIAHSLGVSSRELSQVINQTFNKRFFDFVNSFRIEAAKKLLADRSNHMTVQEIMYSVGFSSKSSFNTIFKRKTNKTPTAFRNASGISR
ncbi:MAG TPA: helix-turn-helix domain-containing protein [Eudoraea sp.]|nr:helix-turn-helix domain-containing protein [Eudoraea sp.]